MHKHKRAPTPIKVPGLFFRFRSRVDLQEINISAALMSTASPTLATVKPCIAVVADENPAVIIGALMPPVLDGLGVADDALDA